MENQTTIAELFGKEGISFAVPAYQRAYSWTIGKGPEKGQVDLFLDDVREQNSSAPYYLGHFLFEKSHNNDYLIIDGQQRLTTIVIFMSCLVKELQQRGISIEWDNNKYPADRILQLYLQPLYTKQRFSTVKEDAIFF